MAVNWERKKKSINAVNRCSGKQCELRGQSNQTHNALTMAALKLNAINQKHKIKYTKCWKFNNQLNRTNNEFYSKLDKSIIFVYVHRTVSFCWRLKCEIAVKKQKDVWNHLEAEFHRTWYVLTRLQIFAKQNIKRGNLNCQKKKNKRARIATEFYISIASTAKPNSEVFSRNTQRFDDITWLWNNLRCSSERWLSKQIKVCNIDFQRISIKWIVG